MYAILAQPTSFIQTELFVCPNVRRHTHTELLISRKIFRLGVLPHVTCGDETAFTPVGKHESSVMGMKSKQNTSIVHGYGDLRKCPAKRPICLLQQIAVY